MKKIVFWVLGSFAFLLTLVISLVLGLLGTETGVSWALGQAQRSVPETLSIGGVQGHLLDRLVLEDVSLNLASADIDLGELIFDWSPKRLVRRQMMLNSLALTSVRVRSKPVDEPPEEPLAWPIELPEISPPVDVLISTIDITDVEFLSAPDAAPLVLEKAELGLRWTSEEGIVLERLQARGPGFELALEGKLDPLENYALQLRDRATLALEDGTEFALAGTIEGPIGGSDGSLALDQQLTGALDLALSGTVAQPMVDPAWNLLMQLRELPGELLGAGLPLSLRGEFEIDGRFDPPSGAGVANVKGHLDSASEQVELDGLSGRLQLAADIAQQKLSLEQLELTQDGQPMRLTLAGEVSAEAVALDGDWEALQWPAGDIPVFRTQKGELSVHGPLTGYRLELSADVEGESVPPGQWQLAGVGDQESLQLEGLVGQLLEGELTVSGDVSWAPEVDWKLRAGAATIRPGELLAVDPDAVFSLQLTSEGRITDAGPIAQVELQDVGGRLIGQPLSGGGSLSYSADGLVVDGLALRNGDMALSADGAIGAQSDLGWELRLPSLGQLLPEASGSVSSEGRLTGPQGAPRIVGEVRIVGVDYQDLGLETLSADIDLDLQDVQRSAVRIDGSTLASGDQVIQQLSLVFDGFIREHNLTLSAAHPQATLGLALAGGYDQDGGLWSGMLDKLDIDSESFGPWRLQGPSELVLGAAEAQADTLCLSREEAKLCADGAWQAPEQEGGEASTEASFELAELPLAWFGSVLPEQLRSFSGSLSANGELSQQQQLEASLIANLTPGELIFAAADGDVTMAHSGMDLDAKAAAGGVSAVLRAGVSSSTVRADMKLPDLLEVSEPGQARLEGELELDVPDLDLLPLLAPTAIESIDGNISGRFAIGGQIDRPDVNGGARLAIATLDLPPTGLKLEDTQLSVDIAGREAKIDGQLTSGGRINISGDAELDAEKGWPLSIAIAGEEFMATDLPNLQVLLSPDLKITKGPEGVALTGRVTIPQAELLIQQLPEGARDSSADVVVVLDEEPEETTPVATDLVVELGDKVHVAALGLNAFLKGQIELKAAPGDPPRATGDIRIDEGTFRAFSQQLTIERGLFSFAGSPLDNPGINVRAVRPIDDVEVGVNVLGSARKMTITTFSSPAMSENDRISYLVTGKPASEGANLSLNREIAKNLSVGVSVDTQTGERMFVTRYRLSRTLHTEVGSGERSSTLDLFYTLER